MSESSNLSDILNDNSVVDFAESHPLVLVAVIVVLVLIIVAYVVYSYWPASKEKLGSDNSKKYLNDDEEIDDLLKSIRDKQKKNLQLVQ